MKNGLAREDLERLGVDVDDLMPTSGSKVIPDAPKVLTDLSFTKGRTSIKDALGPGKILSLLAVKEVTLRSILQEKGFMHTGRPNHLEERRAIPYLGVLGLCFAICHLTCSQS